MDNDTAQVFRLEDHPDLSQAELVALSGLTDLEVVELIDFGVITPVDQKAEIPAFSATWLVVTRTAFRLRCAFDLEHGGLAITVTLLQRIEGLEADLCRARARIPGVGAARRQPPH